MNTIEKEIARLNRIIDPKNQNKILLTVHQQVKRRIHDQGKAADRSQIGTYSEEYLKQRQKKGLGSSKKVILEFTGQMRRDFVPIKKGQKIIGSGFTNNANFDKSQWVENTYKKKIYALTKQENELLVKLFEEL